MTAAAGSKYEEDVIDEEEYQMFKRLKELRHIYRETFEELKQLRQAVDDAAKHVEAKRAQLVQQFRCESGHLSGEETKGWDDDNNIRPEAELDDQEMFDRLAHDRIMQQVNIPSLLPLGTVSARSNCTHGDYHRILKVWHFTKPKRHALLACHNMQTPSSSCSE